MDWYDCLTHNPGCDLAYIRDFVHPDTVCSCVHRTMASVPAKQESYSPMIREWLELFKIRITEPEVRVTIYSTGSLRLGLASRECGM